MPTRKQKKKEEVFLAFQNSMFVGKPENHQILSLALIRESDRLLAGKVHDGGRPSLRQSGIPDTLILWYRSLVALIC